MKPTPIYRIIIDCDGNNTKAYMIINGKEIKTSTAKRNPNDKHDWKMAANVAFDRLWQKQEKQEEKKQDCAFKVGDRVVANKRCYYEGKHGRIVFIQHEKHLNFCRIGVEFDEYVGGHDCYGNAKSGHGWWVSDRFIRHEKPTKPEVREVKRTAKVGEWVKIVNPQGCTTEGYKKDDILQVVEPFGNLGVTLNCGGAYAEHDEYVVLEGYKPEGK